MRKYARFVVRNQTAGVLVLEKEPTKKKPRAKRKRRAVPKKKAQVRSTLIQSPSPSPQGVGGGTNGRAPDPAGLGDPAPSSGTEENLDDIDRFFHSTATPTPADQLAAPKPQPKIDPDLVGKLVAFPFGYWARIAKTPAYALEREEQDLLGSATARMIDKYLPDAMDDFGEETVLLAALLLILAPRMLTAKPENEKPNRVDPGPQGPRQNDAGSVFDTHFPAEDYP